MRDRGRESEGQLLDAAPASHSEASPRPADATPRPSPELEPAGAATPGPSARGDEVRLAHPVVLVDPRALTWLALRSFRRHRIPIHVFSERALDPALHARGVTGHRLPRMLMRPHHWQARLLELAALLEPRPVLLPCSKRARDLMHEQCDTLQPHFELAHLEALEEPGYDCADFRSERALHRTVVRGEPAFEVQVTLDAEGNCNAACVLTWMASVPPNLVVTSVEGHEVLERSLEWLRARRVRGYARLIWAPDRFGRVDLQSAGTLPGSGWVMAMEDGVDFPLMWYACLARAKLPAQFAARRLSRQVRVGQFDAHALTAPLVAPPAPSWREDPAARIAAFLGRILGANASGAPARDSDTFE